MSSMSDKLLDSTSIRIKEIPRIDIDIHPKCFTCITCCNLCYCCLASVCDVSVTCCCRPCIKPKRPTWNRKFQASVSILRNTTNSFVPAKSSVRIVRAIIDSNPPGFLLPNNIKIVSQIIDNNNTNKMEWIFRNNIGLPVFPSDGSQYISDRKFMLYIHGGGFVFGSCGSHRIIVTKLAQELDCTILSTEYRRPPEYMHPIAELDCLEVYKWMIQRINPSKIYIAGDSAGGCLAITVMMRARDLGLPLPAGAILLSPWVDMYGSNYESMQTNVCFDYLPIKIMPFISQLYIDPPTDIHSPLYRSLIGLPPMMVEIGKAEILASQIHEFIARCVAVGVPIEYNEYDDMVHVFQFLHMTNVPACNASFKNMKIFIDKIDLQNQNNSNQIKETKEIKEIKDIKEIKETKEIKEINEVEVEVEVVNDIETGNNNETTITKIDEIVVEEQPLVVSEEKVEVVVIPSDERLSETNDSDMLLRDSTRPTMKA